MTKGIKYTVIIILILIKSSYYSQNSYYSQKYDYNDYADNGSFTHKLSNEFLNFKTKEYNIKTMTEWRYELDDNNNYSDSTKLYLYKFDELGQVIEKQRRFSNNGKKYISIKYKYNKEKTKIDTIITNPYPPVSSYVLDGIYVKGNYEYSEKRNGYNEVTYVEVINDPRYSDNLTILFYYKRQMMFESIEVTFGDKIYEHEFEYTYHESYKY